MAHTQLDTADTLERRASILKHYIKTRVSHTANVAAGVIRCILSVSELAREYQSEHNFAVMIANAFRSSVELGSKTSSEVQLYNDGTIWIEGSFELAQLRKYLLTIPQPVQIEGEKSDE